MLIRCDQLRDLLCFSAADRRIRGEPGQVGHVGGDPTNAAMVIAASRAQPERVDPLLGASARQRRDVGEGQAGDGPGKLRPRAGPERAAGQETVRPAGDQRPASPQRRGVPGGLDPQPG